MGASRILGALLCVGCVVVAVFYILFAIAPGVWIFAPYTAPLWLVLPVVVGILVLAGLGFWLGWIMVSTKEVVPSPTVERKRKRRR